MTGADLTAALAAGGQAGPGLRATEAPFAVLLAKVDCGTEVTVARERVICGKRVYEGIGVIPSEAYAESKGLLLHAMRDAEHRGQPTPGVSYGVSEDWGVRMAVLAVACTDYQPHWRVHRAAAALLETSPSGAEWWLMMMLRPGDPGARGRAAFRIMSEMVSL